MCHIWLQHREPKHAIRNFYDVGDDKTTAIYKECQSDISNRVLWLKCHRKKCPVLRNFQKKRTFDCTENDETSHELNETTPKRPELQQPSVMKYGMSTDSKMKAQLDKQTACASFYMPAIFDSIFSSRLCFQCNCD